jgi:hypothetical protein
VSCRIRLQIESREVLAAGAAFGECGAYESLNGCAHFAVDPKAAAYRDVVDLAAAPTNTAGEVEFDADFLLLKPVDPLRGNRRILFDVVNRGNVRALQFFNDAEPTNSPRTLAHAGNGFLMRRGYTVAALAWQGDILPGVERMSMRLPLAGKADAPLTGPMRAEFIVDRAGINCLPLSGNDFTRSYPTNSLDTGVAQFTCREYAHHARQPISAHRWHFARPDADGWPVASNLHCYLPEGFRPGWIYELVYTAQEPLVLGLGFSAVRDFLAFLRHAERDDGGVDNPLRENGATVERIYGWGRSQSGRYLREFVYRGWNEDAHARRVFDGVHPHVTGSGRVTLNFRFAQPGRYPRTHEDHLVASDQFPFAYGLCTDPYGGGADALLRRPNSDPLVIHSQTASEYWQRRGSLVHTDAFGVDLPEHPRARVYFFASSQHFAEPRGKPQRGAHRHLSNPLDTAPLLRALLDALDAWSSYGTLPPPSRIPRRAEATLVAAAEACLRFPAIPGVSYPGGPNRLHWTDYGAQFSQGYFMREPPAADSGREYAVLVPQVDADGNDAAGIRTPHIEVPLATHTGWNFRNAGATDTLYSIVGSFIAFPATRAHRETTKDPRLSVAERYRSRHDYVARIAVAAHALVRARLLLDEDLERYVARAIEGDDFPQL